MAGFAAISCICLTMNNREMTMKKFLFILALSGLIQTPAFATHYIDLSHELSDKTLNWPGQKNFKPSDTYEENLPGNASVRTRDFQATEHTGTHIDAPVHFSKGHIDISQVKLSQLIGPAIQVDVHNKVKSNPDYQIDIPDFLEWEKKYGLIPPNSIIMLNTGYDKYWNDFKKYSGTSRTDKDAATDFHFPGLHPKAAEWLVNQRKVKAVGIDTFSIDYGKTNNFPTHQILTNKDIPIFENVCHLDELPPNHFNIFAMPLKIKNGTGSPARIAAELP